MTAPGSRRSYLFSLVLLVVIYCIVGFYPFKLVPLSTGLQANGAELTPGTGLYFRSAGIAYTPVAPAWLQQAIAISSFELSLEVLTTEEQQFGPARIFTLSSNPVLRNITVGQQGSSLDVRVRSQRTTLNGTPGYGIKNVFAEPGWHRIDIEISGKALEIRVDGDMLVIEQLTEPVMDVWDSGYQIAFGNELSGDRPWLGEIRMAVVQVGDHSFDYLAPGALQIVDNFSVMKANTAHFTTFTNLQFNNASIFDWAINFLGFWPFGWLVGMLRRPRSGILLATLLAAAMSATIETSQLLFLVDRFPSSVDLFFNTLGGAMGAWVANNFDLSVKKRPVRAREE